MKQSWEEYVEGRLQLGGCVLVILIILIVIAAIVVGISKLINDFNILKLLAVLSFIPAAVLIIWSSFWKK